MNEIYLITDKTNGKVYVGATSRGYLKRWKEHKGVATSDYNTYGYQDYCLYQNMIAHGVENFDIELLESNVADEAVAQVEKYYMDKYNSLDPDQGYNISDNTFTFVGHKHTEEAKKKISNSLKGHVFPESRNKKISESQKGREYKQEWRDALSAVRMGRFTGEDNPFYGKHHSDKTKRIISECNSKYPVLQIDKNTHEVLNEFRNCNEAGQWVIDHGYSKAKDRGTAGGAINSVCNSTNQRVSAYTFLWKWKIDEGPSTN